MIRDRRKTRPARRCGAGAALVRASLLFGPIALAIAFGVSPKGDRQDRVFSQIGSEGVDTMTTGSISSSRYAFALGHPGAPNGSAPCLRFPDGTQRGAC